MKTLILIILIAFCSGTNIIGQSKEEDLVNRINKYAAEIDTLARHNKLSLLIFAKISEKDSLIQIVDPNKWPDGIESSYNLFYDATGKLVLYLEIPFSQSGDWYAEYRHYFDSHGRIVLFDYSISSFSSGCTEILRQERKYFYAENGLVADSLTTLKDKDYKEVSAKNCSMNYDFPYIIYSNVYALPDLIQKKIRYIRGVEP